MNCWGFAGSSPAHQRRAGFMPVIQSLCAFAVRHLIDGACAVVGIDGGGAAVADFLGRHFTDHSRKVTAALEVASERAWKALEVALAGESLANLLVSTEDREISRQIRAFLDGSPDALPAIDPPFRQRCLRQLRAARKA